MKNDYQKDSLTLYGAVAMGTGVMIGAGIFALTGQIAEMAGRLFPYVFVVAAVFTAFSAYSYVKLANAYPSAGGIAMFLVKAYGRGTTTAVFSLLMALSMVISESLVARTFGTYVLQLFDVANAFFWVPALGVALLIFAFLVNISGNRLVGSFSLVMATLKVIGIAVLALAGLLAASQLSSETPGVGTDASPLGFLAATAFGILAFKGFTTITNSGSEIEDPHRNIGRAIILSITICFVVYLLVAFSVGASLPLEQIIAARDFAMAEAARPALGNIGLWLTVVLAIIATCSGVIASVFAVSRMLAMLTEMQLIPHRHFGMPGRLQSHTLVYTIVMAIVLTVFFDLSRIASLGAIFYLIMDIAVHWGVLRYLRKEVAARSVIVVGAIVIDLAVLAALIGVKATSDPAILLVAAGIMAFVVLGERLFLRKGVSTEHGHH